MNFSSLIKWIATVLGIVIFLMCNLSALAGEVLADIPAIATKSQAEVAKLLGSPTSQSKSKYGAKCVYSKGAIEIVFINGKADWITVYLPNASYSKEALAFLKLPVKSPTFSNANVIRWTNLPGLLEVSIFPSGNKVDYEYIKVKTK
ncbi:MAG: hypothetical protein FJY97_06460 [candidate division Zixibacteria bacterium]|nr:hypothetical protein [candidate division Zixibacteria bacterium]